MKIRLAKLVDISNISTLYRTLFQTMAELQIEYYRKADQDVDFLKSVINSDNQRARRIRRRADELVSNHSLSAFSFHKHRLDKPTK